VATSPAAFPFVRFPARRLPFLRSAAVWAGRLLLALYFVAATLILVGRYLLMPEIAAHKDWVAERLSASIGLPVRIGGLAAAWPGLHPRLHIEDLRILDAEGRPALAFDRVEATIGWSSLWRFAVHLRRLEIHAPVLDIRRDASGTLHVAGLAVQGDDKGGFLDWLLAQGRVVVRDAQLVWHDDLRAAPPFVLRDLNFELRNFGRHHSFGLEATPPEGVAARLDLRGNLIGRDPDALASWRGELFADLDQAEVAAWSPWLDLPLEWTRGRGALRLWLDFADLAPTGVTAEVRLADVAMRLRPDLPVLDLEYLDGRIEARLKGERGEGFSGSLRRLALATRDGIVVPPTDARLAVDLRGERESGEFHANGLDLGVLARLIGHLPLPARLHERLRELAPQGRLTGLEVVWRGKIGVPERWKAKANFEGLGLAAWKELPGFSGMTGSLEGDEKAGSVRLDSRGARLELPAVFPEPTLTFAHLEAELGWRARGQGFDLQLARVAFHNADARGEASGAYRYTGEGPGEIDLAAKLTQAAGNAVWRYMPLAVNPDVRDWLRAGIVGGRSETASLRLKGPLAEFPYRGGKGGLFQVRGTIQGVSIDFAPGWPRMTGIDGDLLFENERMTIRGQRGTIMGVALSDIRAEIPDLEADEELLVVSGRARGAAQRFLDFIEASPVGAMIDHFTEPMQAKGDGELDLKLKMPLRRVVDTEVDGRYRFANNELRVLPELPPFMAAQGEFAFTADRLEAKNLRARFLGAPVNVDVSTASGGIVKVTAVGRLAAQALRQRPEFEGWRVFDHLSGETPWRASVIVKKPGAEVQIDSTLEGLSSSLPAPLNKTVRAPLPLKVSARIDPRGDEWTATLGGALSLRLQQTSGAWRGSLLLGGAVARQDIALPGEGLRVAASLPHIDLDAWQAALSANGASSGAAASLPLSTIDLRAGELRLARRNFHGVEASATRQGELWRIAIDSREAQGRLNWDGRGAGRLSGRFARLHLPASEGSPAPPDDAAEPPTVDLVIDSLRVRDMALGEARIAAGDRAGAWRAKVDVTNDAARLSAEGVWQRGAGTSNTAFDFRLDILDAEKLLGRLGMHDAVRRGSGSLEGSLGWRGAPQSFELSGISGRLRADIEKGQFKKLEPGVGRLLGVLSLQSLPRRITLDFRDVFSEGFAFDSIAGEARLVQGVMHTENLQIRGPAARVMLSGQVDLLKETQALRVRVQPAIGDTVSTGAMLVNPVAGAVVWLAQKALGDPFGQAFAYEYAVTGGWSEPKVEKVAAMPPAGTEPAQNIPQATSSP